MYDLLDGLFKINLSNFFWSNTNVLNFSITEILYLRITTRGDPVTGLPPKLGYQHPCSEDEKMRPIISEDCNAQLTMRPTPNVNYKGDLDCQNYKTRTYLPNPISHTIYLDILFTKAVDILKFLKGIGVAQEVARGPDKSTVCRLITGNNELYTAVFFDVNKSRENPSNLDSIIYYLSGKWTIREISNFYKLLDKKLVLISKNPDIFSNSGLKSNVKRCVLSKQTSIYFEVKDDNIVILTLFDNRKNPKSIKI